MRGPLVGLTDEELLDIARSASTASGPRPTRIPRFSMTDRRRSRHASVARRRLVDPAGPAAARAATTPTLLLAEAVERLAVRPDPSVRGRRDRSARARRECRGLLERARPYGVAGLQGVRPRSRQGMAAGRGTPQRGPCRRGRRGGRDHHDPQRQGLEWPVVIPINTATLLRSREPFVYRAADDTLHWIDRRCRSTGAASLRSSAGRRKLARERNASGMSRARAPGSC